MRQACARRSLAVAAIIILQLTAIRGAQRAPAFAYVSNERDGTITVINTATDTVASTIRVGGRLRGIHLSPNGKRLYVAMTYPSNQRGAEADKIVAIDAASGNVIAKYDAGSDPEQFAVSRDGLRLYTSNEDAGTASVTDLRTGRVIATHVVGIEPEGVALSPDGRWVYVTSESSSNVTVIDTRTNKVKATFPVGARPRNAAFSPDGLRAYVTAENGGTVSVVNTATHKVIDAATNRVIATVRVGDGPWGIAIGR